MSFNSFDYLNVLDDLSFGDVPDPVLNKLLSYAKPLYQSDLQNYYDKPMLWIGMYIALASLLCIFLMVADLLHGLRNSKFWIPSKYFSINAASLSVITVAMKLPVDLTSAMPGHVDQVAKLGSMAFMCTMMASLLPSLAAMDTNQLLTNITALGVLIITLVVNVCIQINTGVVASIDKGDANFKRKAVEEVFSRFSSRQVSVSAINHGYEKIAIVYVTILLLLLIIHVCSSLAILKSKHIIETKYQHLCHETASQQSSGGLLLTVEKLRQQVRNYWIMAGSGSPQFIAACSVTTTASGVICVVTTILHTLTMYGTIIAIKEHDYGSDYKGSMLVILVVQFIGVIVGAIAPFCRFFATLSFKMSINNIWNHMKVFQVESYWSDKLCEWKQGRVLFPVRSHILKAVIHYSRDLILNFCIKFQVTIVVVCKTISLIPFFFMICVWCFFHCLKWLLKSIFRSSRKEFERLEKNRDFARYVLQVQDEMELADRTLDGLSKSANRVIQKGEKKQPNNLKSLILDKSTSDFQQVLKFDDTHHVCWNLPVVTLTTIAVSLPDIKKEQVDSLLNSVREGLEYVTLVEENLNTTNDYVSIQKAAETLWIEVDVRHKWLGNNLQNHVYVSDQMDKTGKIVTWFRDTAERIRSSNDDLTSQSICANSMISITKTILLSYQANIDDKVSQMQLFDKLSKTIADIMAACLTNLPQVILMKCHMSVIEKWEASVEVAAKLLGETEQMIKIVQDRQPEGMEKNNLPFIGKWRAYLANIGNP